MVKTIWNAYLGDLRTWSLGIAGAGIIVAAAAAPPEPHGRPSWSQIPAPLRGVLLLVAGAVVLADRELALNLARRRQPPASCSTSAHVTCSPGPTRA